MYSYIDLFTRYQSLAEERQQAEENKNSYVLAESMANPIQTSLLYHSIGRSMLLNNFADTDMSTYPNLRLP